MSDSEQSPGTAPVPAVTPQENTSTRTSSSVLVYGGTPSSYQDLANQKKAYDSSQRRAGSDQRFQATREMPDYARMRSRRLDSKAHVILEVRNDDGSTLDWVVCDVSTIPNGDGVELLLVIACPVCILKRRQPSEDSQMQLRQSNRGFTLDSKGQGDMWVNPKDHREVYLQAGTVSTHEAFRCNNGCHTRYQIDKNVLRIV